MLIFHQLSINKNAPLRELNVISCIFQCALLWPMNSTNISRAMAFGCNRKVMTCSFATLMLGLYRVGAAAMSGPRYAHLT